MTFSASIYIELAANGTGALIWRVAPGASLPVCPGSHLFFTFGAGSFCDCWNRRQTTTLQSTFQNFYDLSSVSVVTAHEFFHRWPRWRPTFLGWGGCILEEVHPLQGSSELNFRTLHRFLSTRLFVVQKDADTHQSDTSAGSVARSSSSRWRRRRLRSSFLISLNLLSSVSLRSVSRSLLLVSNLVYLSPLLLPPLVRS